jgi:hypothetical protein
MRSELYPSNHFAIPLVQILAEAMSEVATVFVLLGELMAPRLNTFRKTDRSEPPDALVHLAIV